MTAPNKTKDKDEPWRSFVPECEQATLVAPEANFM